MQGRNIPNYLSQAILMLVFCFPLAIVAIIKAAQVNAHIKSGNFEGAIQSSDNAKKWCWISFIAGIIFWGVIIIISLNSGY